MEIIKTDIEGLMIRLNKVLKDNRGFLAELAPLGMQDPFFSAGVKNVYISVANKKHIPRAGCLHKKTIENFYTLSGTALWFFWDTRKNSSTFNKVFSIILGSEPPSNARDPAITIEDSKMAHVYVPTGVYHVFLPLTDEPVAVLAMSSHPYDKEDYEKIDFKTIPKIKEKLEEYGIVI
ncbi:MAG: dTDP-4-dehydrorhamnose 3,5-epimerase family protein [Candidatus Aenigmarchaeota archaeon]|nr:dTDP-4-dehydrorhamnose 3,5-epimerase family protein [Candidatus Aenigmarchaeota archaeon]